MIILKFMQLTAAFHNFSNSQKIFSAYVISLYDLSILFSNQILNTWYL